VNEEMFQNQGSSANGPGRLLQQAREEKNLRPEDVAYELRLTVTQVRALEEDDYSRMPETTYVRGYLRNYAKLVGVPENDILVTFARLTRSSENKTQAVLPTSESDAKKTPKGLALLFLGLVLAIVIFISVWVFIPDDNGQLDENKAEAPKSEVIEEKLLVTDIPLGASTLNLNIPAETSSIVKEAGVVKETVKPVSEATPDTAENKSDKKINAGTSTEQAPNTSGEVDAATTGADQVQLESVELESEAKPVVVTAVDSTNTAPADKGGTLFINYSKDSWTDVRDANGKKLLYRTGKKGEKIALAGKPPFSLFFGFAQGVKVTFNGAEIDVEAHTRGVFARFTLGESANP
jgi:cytoskeleton protein RodZ